MFIWSFTKAQQGCDLHIPLELPGMLTEVRAPAANISLVFLCIMPEPLFHLFPFISLPSPSWPLRSLLRHQNASTTTRCHQQCLPFGQCPICTDKLTQAGYLWKIPHYSVPPCRRWVGPHLLPVPEGDQDLLLFVADVVQHRDLCVNCQVSWHAGFSFLICPLPSHGWPVRFTVVYTGLPAIWNTR